MRLHDDRARKIALSKPKYSTAPYHDKRPRGITFICILLALGMFVNMIDAIFYLSLYPPLYVCYILFIASIQFFSVYGLWNLKEWGRKLTIALYGYNIFLKFIIMITGYDIIVDLFINSPETSSNIQESFFSQFFMALVIGLIIIKYLLSKKSYFDEDPFI